MKRYLGYIRVSTTQQEENGYGPDIQREGIEAYAARYGYPLSPSDFFTDDISGDEPEREGLNRIKALLRAGKAAGVIIFRPDRLARKGWIGMQALEDFHAWGAEVHFQNLGFIPNTPEGRFQASIHFSVGELGKAQMLQNLNNAVRAKAEKHGLPINKGRYPYGYRFEGSKNTSALVIYEAEAEVIRAIFRMHREGSTTEQILKWLSDNQKPTAEDRRLTSGKKREYGEWAFSQVYKILKNPIYKGKMPYFRYYPAVREDGTTYQRAKPLDDPSIVWVNVNAIVSPEEWELTQQIISQNRLTPVHDIHNRYLLSGMLKCGLCSYRVSGRRWSDPQKPHLQPQYYYNCNAHWGNKKGRNAMHACSLPPFKREAVEEATWGYIEAQILNPEALEKGLRGMYSHTEEEQANLEEKMARLLRKIAETQAQQDRIKNLYIKGIYSEEELTTNKRQLDEMQAQDKAGLQELERQIARLGASELEIASLRRFSAAIRDKVEQFTWENKKHVLELLGTEVELTVEDGQKVIYVTTHLQPGQERIELVGRKQGGKEGGSLEVVSTSGR